MFTKDMLIEQLSDKEFVLSHLYIGLQRASEQELIKRDCDFEGVEAYLYLRFPNDDGVAAVKLKEGILEKSNTSIDEAWSVAAENVHKEIKISPIFNAISSLLGTDLDEELLEDESVGIYVVTNNMMHHGASAILDKDVFNTLSNKMHTNKFVVIPCSIHEMIVLPDLDGVDIENINDMVKQVNATELEPEDVLADRAFKVAV